MQSRRHARVPGGRREYHSCLGSKSGSDVLLHLIHRRKQRLDSFLNFPWRRLIALELLKKPSRKQWPFIPANSSSSGSQGISDFIATTRVNIWFNSALGSEYIKVSGQNNLGDVPSKSDPATMITLAAAGSALS